MYYYAAVGWLKEPESRPTFAMLASRFFEMVDDPLRYILTTMDGAVENYNMLPSNTNNPGEFTYENNPFMTSMQSFDRSTLSPPPSAYDNGVGFSSSTFDAVSCVTFVARGLICTNITYF